MTAPRSSIGRFRASTRSIEAMSEIHRGLLDTMLSLAEEVHRARHPEPLHDFRVAVRRTRSALSQIKDVFPPEAVAHFSTEFKWLGSRTGPVRDLDVFILNIPDLQEALGVDGAAHLEPMHRLLKEKRRREVRRLRSCIRSKRIQQLFTQWADFLSAPEAQGPEGPLAREPIRSLSSGRLQDRYQRILDHIMGLEGSVSHGDLHRISIDCKKLRYLLSFFRDVYPPPAVNVLVEELKVVQDHLGRFNDLRVQGDTLGRLAQELMDSDNSPPATLLGIGRLMCRLEAERNAELRAAHQYLTRFSRREVRDRFQEIVGFRGNERASRP